MKKLLFSLGIAMFLFGLSWFCYWAVQDTPIWDDPIHPKLGTLGVISLIGIPLSIAGFLIAGTAIFQDEHEKKSEAKKKK